MPNTPKPSNMSFHGNSNTIDMFNTFDILESPEIVSNIIPPLVGYLQRFDRNKTVSRLAAYTMTQANHKHIMRLDILIRLAMLNCVGSTTPRLEHLGNILNKYIHRKSIQKLEDSPMYPFAETFLGRYDDALLLNGSLCPAVRTSQYAYDALLSLSGSQFNTYIDQVDTLIRFINLFNEQQDFTVEYDSSLRDKETVDTRLFKKASISKKSLSNNSISLSCLAPFIFDASLGSSESSQSKRNNILDYTPLIETENDIIVAAPHCFALSIKNFILSAVRTEEKSEEFQAALAKIEQTEMKRHSFKELENKMTEHVYNCRVERSHRLIGTGRYLLTYHIIEPIEDARHLDYEQYRDNIDQLVGALHSKIGEFVKELAAETNFHHTQTVIVTSSNQIRLGMCNKYAPTSDYTVFSLHPEDIVICSRVFNLTANDLWRYGKILTDLTSDGLELLNQGTFINLIAYLVQNSNQVSGSENDQNSRPNFIYIGYELEKMTRDRCVNDRNLRTRLLPNQERVRTERFANTPIKTFDKSQFTAVDHDRDLIGVCSEYTTFWLESGKPVDALSEFEYFVWDTLHAILTYLGRSEHLGSVGSKRVDPVLVTLKFSNAVSTKTLDSTEPEKIFQLRTDIRTRTIEVVVHTDWYSQHGHGRVGWSSQIVKEFMDCLMQLDPLKEPEHSAMTSIVEKVKSGGFEFGLIKDSEDYIDYMISRGIYDQCIPIEPSAVYLTRANSKKRIYDKEDCTKFENSRLLRDYSDHCLNELTSRIRQLDRENLLDICLQQHHNAIIEERRWYNSSNPRKNVLGKNIAREDYNRAYRRASSVMRATTIIIEVSIHDAGKQGSQKIGCMEFEELMALALEIFKVQVDIDVERYRPEDTQVLFGFDGAIKVDNKLNQDSLSIITDQIMKPIDDLLDISRREKERKRSKSFTKVDKRLEEPFVCEYGMSISKISSFLYSVADLAVKNRGSYVRIRKSALQSSILKDKEFTESEINSMVHRLTIEPRLTFNCLKVGMHPRDLLFSRYSRGQSLISRPIIVLNDGEDSEYLISPLMIFRTLNHSLNGVTEGRLKGKNFFTSAEMQTYTNKISEEKGKVFNLEVANVIKQVGFEVHCEVKMTEALGIQSSKITKRLGPVDVLAIDRNNSVVWVVEAKNLKFCHTVGEVADRLKSYTGRTKETKDTKPDQLQRHLDRVDYLRQHRDSLAHKYKLDSNFEIRGLLVFSMPQLVGSREWEIGTDQESVTIDKLQDYLQKHSTKSVKN